MTDIETEVKVFSNGKLIFFVSFDGQVEVRTKVFEVEVPRVSRKEPPLHGP